MNLDLHHLSIILTSGSTMLFSKSKIVIGRAFTLSFNLELIYNFFQIWFMSAATLNTARPEWMPGQVKFDFFI